MLYSEFNEVRQQFVIMTSFLLFFGSWLKKVTEVNAYYSPNLNVIGKYPYMHIQHVVNESQ